MGAAAADFDNDGWPDIYVACDTAPSLLYRNNHDGTFREIAVPAGLRLRRERRRALGHGRRRRRLRWRRLAGYRAHQLLRPGDDALPQQRRRRVRGREHQGRPGRQPQVRRVRRRTSSTSTTTAGRTSSSPTATCTRRSPARKLHLTYRSRSCCIATWATGASRTCPRRPATAITAPNVGRGCAFGDFDNDGRRGRRSSTTWTGRPRCCATRRQRQQLAPGQVRRERAPTASAIGTRVRSRPAGATRSTR